MAPAGAVVTQATTTSLGSGGTTADAVYAGLPDNSGIADSASGGADSTGSNGHAQHQSTAVEQPAQLRSTALDFPASLQPAIQPVRSDMPGMNGPPSLSST